MAGLASGAGVVAPPRVALPVIRWRDAPAHAVMLAVMAGTMVGAHSSLRDLVGIGALVVASLAYARGARTDVVFREHLVDLWVMALVLVACLPGHGGHGSEHQHFSLPGGPAVVAIALAGWVSARLVLARRAPGSWSRASLVSGAVVAATLALMLALCALH